MKKFWICLLLVLLTGCGTPTEEVAFSGSVFTSAEEVYAVDLEETYPESLGKGGKNYRNLEALAGDADAVVLGCATYVKKNGSGFATEFVVQEYWQGSLWKGALITVREKGGIPPMEPDGTYLLFLQGEYPEYSLCGAVQGRFVERNGYLFQQTWKSRKIPEAPARTENLENAVYWLQPHPADDLGGPPWTLDFENGDALKQFLMAAECPEVYAHWLEENRMVHKGMLSEFEEASEIAAVLRKLPLPTLAADLPVDVYPDYGRDYVEIVHRNGEKTCRITIPMEAKTAEEGKYDRPVEAENFQVLFDRTDVLLETETYHHYVGQVNDCQVSFGLWGYEKEEALQFLKALQFETLS